jgi:radical SAM superfamily enzyme YgiQ (UPF0313 family)
MTFKAKAAGGDEDDSPSDTGLCLDFYVFKWVPTKLPSRLCWNAWRRARRCPDCLASTFPASGLLTELSQAIWTISRSRSPGQSEFWVPVQSRRGCPLDCSFCSTAAIEGRGLRQHSPATIAAWLEQLASSGFTNFNFVDNTFNLPPDYAKELCQKIVDRGLAINFWCIIYPKWIDSKLVELMARAGCREISLGFESGSDPMLASLNKRFNAEEVKTVAKMFGDAGIFRRGFLLLGGPGETPESVEESLGFADSLNLDALKVTVGLRIYPETPLAATALAEGEIRPDDVLLWPRFYLAPRLRDWLPERIAAYKTSRPWVM